jgi:hypothetical protein
MTLRDPTFWRDEFGDIRFAWVVAICFAVVLVIVVTVGTVASSLSP